MARWFGALWLAALLLALAGCRSGPAASLTVSAASDLTPAFEEIGRLFTQESGVPVRFNFGASGQLAQQIEQGAPVDVFAAADRRYVEELDRRGLLLSDTVALYARGRLVIWTRTDSRLRFGSLADLTRPEVARIAIANPEHAPYGRAARQALESAGVWAAVQPRLVFGENIRQTFQFADTGNVDAALVAYSLSVHGGGRAVLVPEELHEPLDQTLAVVRSTGQEAAARRFARFVNGPVGRPIMQRYGLVLPGEALPE